MDNMEKHLHVYLLFFCCLYLRGCLCGTSLSVDKCGFSGESVLLSCTLPAVEFVQPLVWSNDINVGDISICIPGGCSTPANPRYTTSANTTGIYLAITSLRRADDETTWGCTLQGSTAATVNVNLVVRDHPSTCTLSGNTDDSYTCETDCGYPTSDLTIDWFANTTSDVVTLTDPSIAIATTGCSSGGKASATLSASAISDYGDLYCKCGMQTVCPEKAPIISNSVAATVAICYSPLKDPNPSSTALIVIGVILITISLCVFGFSIFMYRKSRVPSRTVDQQESVTKPVVFSSVLHSQKEREQVSVKENKSHYQELDPRGIQQPSPYACPSGDDDDAINENERNSYESLQGDPIKQDYEQLDDGSERYANT